MRAAVMTMVRNEAAALPRWIRHYGGQVGHDALVVLDDQSDDGSTTGLGVTVLSLPARATGRRPERRRQASKYDPPAFRKTGLANKFADALLEIYDVVIFTDVDELLIPDPRRYGALTDYLDAHADIDVLAPIGLNLTHVPTLEPPLDANRPLLAQRRFVKVVPNMCKPAVKRIPARWTAGTHGCEKRYSVHRDLFLIHTKFADYAELMATHEQRHNEFLSSGAGPRSTWAMSPDDLAHAYRAWSLVAPNETPATLAPEEIDVDSIVRQLPNGSYKSGGRSAGRSMEVEPLQRLPAYFTDQV